MGSERTGGIIDARGDWAAPPTDAMRKAMAEAEVGDDNSGEDPTVRRLEGLAAEMFDREAALFMPSGTMANLVSILAQTQYGDEIIVGDNAHNFIYEVGGAAVIGGHPYHLVPNDRFGMLDPEDVRNAIRTDGLHFPHTGLLLIENSHNLRGGAVLSPEQVKSLVDAVQPRGVPVHLDGSRIFNAAAALGIPAIELTRGVDTLTFCLSKGLAAPVGSVIVGDAEFILKARRQRKILGGGMRQAGVIAAAGIVGLTEMIERLPEDHAVARRIAEGLADLPGLSVDLETVQTNLVFVDTDGPRDAAQLREALQERGIRVSQFTPTRFRFAVHYCIDLADADRIIRETRDILMA